MARLYLIGLARLSAEERAQRGSLFGAFSDGFRPNTPYRWQLAEGRSLLEIPVTTMPVTRLPFHMSYKEIQANRSRLNCKRLLLTHLHTDALARIPDIPDEVAYDGMRILL